MRCVNSLKVTIEEYTLRVCIFKVGRGLLAGCCIVYLNLGKILNEYTLRVCIFLYGINIIYLPTNRTNRTNLCNRQKKGVYLNDSETLLFYLKYKHD